LGINQEGPIKGSFLGLKGSFLRKERFLPWAFPIKTWEILLTWEIPNFPLIGFGFPLIILPFFPTLN